MKTLKACAVTAVCGVAMVSSVAAADIQLYTEDYAPLNFDRDGQIVASARIRWSK